MPLANQIKILILGGGFGGLAASDVDPSDIVNPFRKMLKHVQFFEAHVESIDLQNKTVEVSAGLSQRRRTFTYDHLVLALGSETKFFDDQTRQHALQM
jgi:NADH dehydrogenase FAD-containing subunit